MTPNFPFAFWKKPSSSWPTGADGALSLNGGSTTIPAGSIKDYSSISIINGGALIITGSETLGLGVNDGHLPTIIGCSGNCTINTGGQIVCRENAGASTEFYGDFDYSAPTVPAGCAVDPISYTRFGGVGGQGGESGGWGTYYGSDLEYGSGPYPTGHGGGGAGYTDGGVTTDGLDWGVSGVGGDSITQTSSGGLSPSINGFSMGGATGLGGETTGISVGGGGEGATRAVSGGCVYLQIAGTANIDANSIDVTGSDGGQGGDGGLADTPDDASYGGGGGGGGCGGGGGTVIIRYKSGSVNASAAMVTAGIGGSGGAGGIATGPFPADGYAGSPGSDGGDGVSDIATY